MKRSHLILAFADWDPAENIIVLISVRMKNCLKKNGLNTILGEMTFLSFFKVVRLLLIIYSINMPI